MHSPGQLNLACSISLVYLQICGFYSFVNFCAFTTGCLENKDQASCQTMTTAATLYLPISTIKLVCEFVLRGTTRCKHQAANSQSVSIHSYGIRIVSIRGPATLLVEWGMSSANIQIKSFICGGSSKKRLTEDSRRQVLFIIGENSMWVERCC